MPDPRRFRTRERLRQAFVSLVCETSYEEVRVSDILARSGVARSTFYARYRDKEDLLITMFLEMLAFMAERGAQTAPDALIPAARPLLDHFAQARELGRAMQRAGKMDVLLRAVEAWLVRDIEARLKPKDPMVPAFAAGAFISLVRWWMGQGMRSEPAEVAAAFEAMVAPGVAAAQSRWYGEPARMVTAR